MHLEVTALLKSKRLRLIELAASDIGKPQRKQSCPKAHEIVIQGSPKTENLLSGYNRIGFGYFLNSLTPVFSLRTDKQM